MTVQCAGCAKIISDDGSGSGNTYGCCAECNKHTFRSKEQEAPVPEAEKPLDAA